jgi:DNA-binding NarL/FixJ family response regulator
MGADLCGSRPENSAGKLNPTICPVAFMDKVPARVALIHNDAGALTFVSGVLKGEPTYDLVAHFTDQECVSRKLVSSRPDLAIIDIDLQHHCAFKLIGDLKRQLPQCASLVFTRNSEAALVLAAFQAGARGYLLEGTSERTFKESLLALQRGEAPVSAIPARHLVRMFHCGGFGARQEPSERLTPREYEVLHAIARGQSYYQAAQALNVTSTTIHAHLKSIYRKLAVHSNLEAVFAARTRNLI